MAHKDQEMMDEGSEYLPQLQAEYDSIDSSFTHAKKLMEGEIQRVKTGGAAAEDKKFIEVHKMAPVKVVVNIILPSKEHPKFNFVGKLLGPGGSSLKRLQSETQTRMAIQGRGSMRDKKKEEELRAQGGPKYSHLNEDLHLKIQAYAPAEEAYSRVANAIRVAQPFLVPEMNDNVSQEQMAQLRGRGVGPNGDSRRGMIEPAGRGMPPRGGDDYYGRFDTQPVGGRSAAYDDYGAADLRSRDPYAAAPPRPAARDPFEPVREARSAPARDPYAYDGYSQPAAAESARERYADYEVPSLKPRSWGGQGNGYQAGGAAGGYGSSGYKTPSARGGGRGGADRAHPYSRGGGRTGGY